MNGVNRHPRPRRLHGWSLRGTHMVERDRWQARLAIRSYAGAMAGRLVWVLLFEHTLLESARFDQCRNRLSALLYLTVRPGTPAEPSDTVRTPRDGASQGDVV